LCCPLSRLCICKLARYSQGNFVLVTGKVREFYIVRPVGTLCQADYSQLNLSKAEVLEICYIYQLASLYHNRNPYMCPSWHNTRNFWR